ncbi:MAG: phosphoribosylanthranilate isomerase [Chloroflexi bacterium]|nr:phosphoribosylanthranilate isomerase [Chloroflexota bacterium]
MTRVKICGIRSAEHGCAALTAGADFLGLVFYRPSHRYVEPSAAREIVAACRAEIGGPERWRAVGVFVDEPVDSVRAIADEVGLDLIQLCGSEDAEYARRVDRPVLRVVHVDGEGRLATSPDASAHAAERILLDTQATGHFGGTGTTYPWAAVREQARTAILAGGLSPSNVAAAIAAASPWGVDVSSGVERDRVKDPDLIRAFISEVRRADR